MMLSGRRRGFVGATYLAAFLVVSVVCATFYCSVPPSPDQSIFDYIGFLGMHGATFYGGAFDISWPAPFLAHEAGVILFGVHTWTARALDLVLLPVGLLGLWLVARAAGFAYAGLACVLVYPVIYVTSGAWMAGHRDIVAMHLLLVAAGMLVPAAPRRWWTRALVGALVAYATMIRPTYLFAIAPFWLLDLRRRRIAPAVAVGIHFAIGAILVFAAFAIAGLIEHTLSDWYRQAVLLPATIYQVHESRARLFGTLLDTLRQTNLWLVAAAAVGQAACLWRWPTLAERSRRAVLLLWSLMATVLVSYFVQNKGFGYHLGGIIPLLLLMATIGLEAALRREPGRAGGWLAVLPLAGLVGAAVLSAGIAARIRHNLLPAAAVLASADPDAIDHYIGARSGQPAARVQAAAILDRDTAPNDLVVQWGWLYEIPFLAERKSATRLLNANILRQIPDRDRSAAAWLEELRRDLVPGRVKAIVVDTSVLPVAALREGRTMHPSDLTPADAILATLVRRGYCVRFRAGDILLLEREPCASRGAASARISAPAG